MVKRLVAVLLFTLALAGCSSDSGSGSTDETGASDDPQSTLPGDSPGVAAPVLETVPVSGEGSLGTFATACERVQGGCHGFTINERTADFFVDRPGSNLTSLDLNLTWTAATLATETLAIGAMVMEDWDGCEICDPTVFDILEGTSPLHYRIEGLAVPLSDQFYVHIFVYDPDAWTDAAVAGVLVYTDQAVTLEGSVVVETPAA
ncbi:MAG TPA: hypothetical protein VI796_05710 [Candidatus Thermoplasmatota archaeon]|nr:hypothetical protein [Candidatus Thermoplasmatota archaeon]